MGTFVTAHTPINLQQKPSSPSLHSPSPLIHRGHLLLFSAAGTWDLATLGPEVPVPCTPLSPASLSPAGLLAEKDSNYCLCRTPCNLTRYNKELSMVKIPSKTSAKYLEKKFNKSEKYIS